MSGLPELNEAGIRRLSEALYKRTYMDLCCAYRAKKRGVKSRKLDVCIVECEEFFTDSFFSDAMNLDGSLFIDRAKRKTAYPSELVLRTTR